MCSMFSPAGAALWLDFESPGAMEGMLFLPTCSRDFETVWERMENWLVVQPISKILVKLEIFPK